MNGAVMENVKQVSFFRPMGTYPVRNMKKHLLVFCLVVLLLHGLSGCGIEETVIVPTLSICGMACVDGLKVDSSFAIRRLPMLCDEQFLRFEENHPSAVCGYNYGVTPASKCVGAVIVGMFMAIACTGICTELPDIQTCSLDCLIREMGLEGNCVVCYVELALELRLCLTKPMITPEEISTCTADYIWKSTAHHT